MPCPHFSAFIYGFVVSIKNSDLDSKYINVGIVNGRLPARIPNGASEFFGRRRSQTIPHSCLELPRLLDRC